MLEEQPGQHFLVLRGLRQMIIARQMRAGDTSAGSKENSRSQIPLSSGVSSRM